ncbi:MAG TPA: acylphosphatase [Rhizomicrobium sp.]|jgi:acylphosphatase
MDRNDDITTLRLRIEGEVQGVGFRYFAIGEARKLAIDGWVLNRSDGSVEALASGSTRAIEAFVAACMRGPPGAKVKNVDLHSAEPPTEQGFHRRPSF